MILHFFQLISLWRVDLSRTWGEPHSQGNVACWSHFPSGSLGKKTL